MEYGNEADASLDASEQELSLHMRLELSSNAVLCYETCMAL